MASYEKKIRKLVEKLTRTRICLLYTKGFYGLLLMRMTYALDTDCHNMRSDGRRIVFHPDFLEALSDQELEYCLTHQILHVALRHIKRREGRVEDQWDRACDIVVNSILREESGIDITLQGRECPHLAPSGKEGCLYSVEEVYRMLGERKEKKGGQENNISSDRQKDMLAEGRWDDHSTWGSEGSMEENMIEKVEWEQQIVEANRRADQKSTAWGGPPKYIQRYLDDLNEGQLDWRGLLAQFIQEEIVDYSLLPPDRRYDESPFFLPDYNDTESQVKDILFMIDTSGSMSDKLVMAVYEEVRGAVRQWHEKLTGWVGFFDENVKAPQPFIDETSFRRILPTGGGGTSYIPIFRYVFEKMEENPPASIIILTYGYCDYPEEKIARGIPVLWIIANSDAQPPWGRVARIKS